MADNIEIRECTALDEFAECITVQREVFALPEQELSPVRHFVVTRNAGGFTLGAFENGRMAGFVLSVPAFLRGERAFYSHMTAVRPEYQSLGLGARLKWAQRERALGDGVRYIKWTFEPVKARNAYFNLMKLGAIVRDYQVNFYGTDYGTANGSGLASDRLFAEWHLNNEKVVSLADAKPIQEERVPVAVISTIDDWTSLVTQNPEEAQAEQLRIRADFHLALGKGYVAREFVRSWDTVPPMYLLYED